MLVGTVSSKDVADQMMKMAANFSKEVVNGLQIALPPRQKQVMLKVRFAEADRNKLIELGIQSLQHRRNEYDRHHRHPAIWTSCERQGAVGTG